VDVYWVHSGEDPLSSEVLGEGLRKFSPKSFVSRNEIKKALNIK